MDQTRPANSAKEEYKDSIAYKNRLAQLSQGAAFGRESLQKQQHSSSLSSSPPLPPAPQPQSRRTRETAASLLLDPSMSEDFGPSKLQPSAIAYCAASPMVIPTSRSRSLSVSSTHQKHHHPNYPRQQQQQQQQDTPGATLRQLPVLRSCAFVLLRVLVFPKTVFVKGVAVGRGCLNKIRVFHNPGHHRYRQNHSHHDPNEPHCSNHRRHHFRSYQHPSAPQLHFEGSSSRRTRSASDPSSHANINASSSSRQHYHRRRRSPHDGHYHYSRKYSFLSTYRDKSLSRGCFSAFLNSYNVQVATVCLCLTGEAFAQAVMCPFLYCMVRDFHVGADKWIGYYAGLLLTGFWGANLATTLFWGYLSDKYGRKAVMLFGLFMTSLSTVYLGLSACYHDAMWALVIQGACTGLVPVSKCAIGELANRQQRIHNAEVALVQLQQRQRQRLQLRLHRQQSPVEWEQGGFLNEMTMDARSKQDRMDDDDRKEAMGHNHDHSFHNADPECEQEKAPVNAQHDFASKGYSALVIALALGAALGPLAGGILTKRMIPGFEAYPYFAPCLLASAVGLFVTGVVALILNETHPKWANSSELEKTLENLSRFESMEGANDIDTADGVTRGRPGYENSRHYKERQPSAIVDKEVVISELNGQDVVASLSVGVTSSTTTSTGTRTRLRQTTGAGVGGGLGVGTITPPTVSCTCRLSESSSTSSLALPPPAYSRPNSKAHPRLQSSFSTLSPATELYLTLAIYTLLVLTSILGSEFVMLYTQSPTFRGGLEFSAKMLGQILTLRGIFKLGFTLCGYPWMVKRWGLLKCLRLGVLAIGTFSVVGLGWLVPWTIIAQHQENRASLSSDAVIGSSSGEDALASNLHTNGSANIAGASEKTPVGMGVILLCLSLVSMGDVLGYVSVLVLFGKSADRMKVAAASRVNNNNNPIDSALCLENQAGAGTIQGSGSGAQAATATQGGSGVLWSVAQVSGNVMRLTGPVIAGLLWSMVETSRTVTITDLHHVNNSSSSSSASSVTKPMENPDSMYTLDPGSTHLSQSASASSPLSYIFEKWSSLSSSLPLLPSSWDYDEASTTNILFGSTSVFYLIGVICLINFIACQYLIRSSSSSASTDDTSSSSPTARSRVQAESSGLALGSGAVLSWSDEQTLQQLEQHQASVTVPAGLDGEERFYSIGHPRVNASFCALHRAPMQTV